MYLDWESGGLVPGPVLCARFLYPQGPVLYPAGLSSCPATKQPASQPSLCRGPPLEQVGSV